MPPKKAAAKKTGGSRAASTAKPTSMKASNAALTKFETDFAKSFGEGKLLRGNRTPVPYIVIPTGSLALDLSTSVGGYVRGRIHEMWGADALGKSTLSMLGVVEAQRAFPDDMCAWVDMEQTWDDKWAIEHGVDLNRLYVYQPDDAEDVADALAKFCRSGQFSFVVIDSVGAMIPRTEKEKMSEEQVVGTQAKIVTRMVKLNAVEASRTGTAVMFINQVRANIGKYGKDTTTGGGWALKHGTTMKFELMRSGTAPYRSGGEESEIVGHELSVRLERNKVGPSHKRALFSLFFVPSGKYGPIGVDKADEAARIGVKVGVIEQSGAWYTTPEGEKFNGLDRVVDHYREHPELVQDMRLHIMETVKGTVVRDEFVEQAS